MELIVQAPKVPGRTIESRNEAVPAFRILAGIEQTVTAVVGLVRGGHEQGGFWELLQCADEALFTKDPGVQHPITTGNLTGVGAVPHDVGHRPPEPFPDRGTGLARILDGVVEQTRNGLVFVAAVFPHQGAHADHMGKEGYGLSLT